MAAAEETEYLLTCSVCWNMFDEDTHKPKYLICHHTFCVKCIKNMVVRAGQNSIMCPLCRKPTKISISVGIEGLSSNPYVIQMIRSSAAITDRLKKRQWYWCLTCNKAATAKVCSSSTSHVTINLGTASPESVAQLMDQKRTDEAQVASIVEKRRGAQSYFGRLLAALKTLEDEVKRHEEDNDVHLAEMASLLECAAISRNETYQSISGRVTQTAELLKKETLDVARLEDLFLKHENTKISVQFKDEQGRFLPTLPLFVQGFSRRELQDRLSAQGRLELVCHILLSVLNESPEKIAPQPDHPPAQAVASIPARIYDPFDVTNWVLLMDIEQFDHYFGRVVIKPHRLNDFLTKELIRFCLRPVGFPTRIDKAHATTFITLEFNTSEAGFEPIIADPDCVLSDTSSVDIAYPLEVGFLNFCSRPYDEDDDFMTHFQLSMLLKPFDGRHMKGSTMFGRIVQGDDVISVLSRSRLNERDGFIVTIQARCRK